MKPSRARQQAVTMPTPPQNPPSLTAKQFRQMLAEVLAADPNLARRVLMPLSGTVFPIQGGVVNTVFTVQDDGKVGIGTPTPGARLEVRQDTGDTAEIRIRNDGTGGMALVFSEGGLYVSLIKHEIGTNNLAFFTNGELSAPKMILTAVGNLGIGTTLPGAKLDVRPEAASTIGLIVQGFSGQTASLQQWKDSSGTVKACIDEGGRLVFNNTDTKQVGGGPELISAQGSSQDNVVLWAGLTTDTEARFLCSHRGFLEWGAGGSNDQDMALFRNQLPGLSIQNFTNTKSTRSFSVNAEYDRSLGLANEEYPLFVVNTNDRSMRLAPGIVAASGVATYPDSDYVCTRAELKTTNDTPTTLFSLNLTSGRAYYITAKVVARQSDGSNRAFYYRAACVYRETGGSNIEGTMENIAEKKSASTWDCTIDVDTNNHIARVRVTGAATGSVFWVGTIEYQSVSTDGL